MIKILSLNSAGIQKFSEVFKKRLQWKMVEKPIKPN